MTHPPIRVALVFDDESVRKALRRLLRSAGINSDSFGTGDAFLESLSRSRPDCVLLDMRMPPTNAAEVLEKLDAMQCRVPAIVVTSQDDEDAACLHTRFPRSSVALRVKPLNDDALLRDIRSAAKARTS